MAEYGDLGTIWASLGLDYSKFDGSVQQVSGKIQALDQETGRALKEIGDKWDDLGKQMSLKITAPLALIGAQMTMTFAKFEQSMANTASVAGATADQLEMMSQAARRAGETTVFSASQAADALYYMASAGYDAEQSVDALNGVLNLAAATQADLAYTSETVAAAISQFGLAASDADRVANVFAATIGNSQATIQKLSDSMRYAGPVAAGFGYSIEETAAALGLLYNAGLRGEQAGTSLRQALQQLANPTGQTKDALEKLGLSADQVNPAMHSLAEIIDTLRQSGIDTTTALQLFGSEAGSGMAALIRQGSEALREMQAEITGTQAAADMAAQQMDTLQGAGKILRSVYEELSITLVENFEPALREGIELITDFLRWLNDLDPVTQRFIVTLGALAAAAGPVLIVMGQIATALSVLAGPAGWIALAAAGATSLAVALAGAERDSRQFYDQTMDSARAAREQADELDKLIEEYRELSGKPDKSKEEHERLKTIMERIIEIQPAIAAGYDDIKDAIDRNIESLEKYADALRTQSELQIQLSAQRAQLERQQLLIEKQSLESQIESLRSQLGPGFDKALERQKQFNEAMRLLLEAETQEAQGMTHDEAYKHLREFLNEVMGPGGTLATQFADLEKEAKQAERAYGHLADTIGSLEQQLQEVNVTLEAGQKAIDAFERLRQGLSPFESKPVPESVPPPSSAGGGTQPSPGTDAKTLEDQILERIRSFQNRLAIAEVEGTERLKEVQAEYLAWLEHEFIALAGDAETQAIVAKELLSLRNRLSKQTEREETVEQQIAKEQSVWRGRIALVRAGVEKYVQQYGDLKQVQQAYIEWLTSQVNNTELAESLRGQLADSLESTKQQLKQLGKEPVELTAQEIADAVQAMVASFGPAAAELRKALDTGKLPFVGDDLEEAKRRIDNFYKDLVESGEIALETHAAVLKYQLASLEQAGEAGSDTWARIREELRRTNEAIEAERKRTDAEKARQEQEEERRLDQRVDSLVELANRQAKLEGWTVSQHADAIQQILDNEQMSAKKRADLAYDVALKRKQAADQAAEAEKRAERESEQEQERLRREKEQADAKAARDEETARRARVQAAIAEVEFVARLNDWSADQIADALERVIDTEKLNAEEQQNLERRVMLLRKQASDERIAAAEQNRKKRLQDAVEEARFLAQLEGWKADQLAEALRNIVRTYEVASEERIDLEREAALLEVRAGKERAAAAEKAAERKRRAAQEAERAQDQAVQREVELIARKAELQDWSAAQHAEALEEILLNEKMSYKLREDLAFQAARLRKQAREEAIEADRKAAEEDERLAEQRTREAKRRAEEEARQRDERVRKAVESMERVAALEDWTLEQQADALQEILNIYEMSAELRADLEYKVALTRKQAAEQAIEAQRKAREEADREAERRARQAEQRAAEEVRRQDQKVRKAVETVRRIAELEDWSLEKQADALEAIVRNYAMSADLESEILHQAALKRKQAQDNEIKELKEARKREEAEERRAAEERERLRVQELNKWIEEIEFRATLNELSAEQQIEMYQVILDHATLTAEERIKLERKVALLTKQAHEDTLAAQAQSTLDQLANMGHSVESYKQQIELLSNLIAAEEAHGRKGGTAWKMYVQALKEAQTELDGLHSSADKFFRMINPDLMSNLDKWNQLTEAIQSAQVHFATMRASVANVLGDLGLDANSPYTRIAQAVAGGAMGSSGGIFGTLSGILAGLAVPGPWAGITAGISIIGQLLDPGPIPQDAQRLKEAVDEVNASLKEFGVAYQSANVKIREQRFLFWRTGWSITGEEAAKQGLEIGQAMLESMNESMRSLGSAFASAISGDSTWDDFEKVLGEQLRRIVLEQILLTAEFEKNAKLIVGLMQESADDGFSEEEVATIRERWRALFSAVQQDWEEMSGILDDLFPDENRVVEHQVKGVQITRLAGRDRDLFVELFRPLSVLDRLPNLLGGEIASLYQTFQESNIGAIHAQEVIIEQLNLYAGDIVVQADRSTNVDRLVNDIVQRALKYSRGRGN